MEGSAGVSIGAYMENADKFHGKNVAIVSCGANIETPADPSTIYKYIESLYTTFLFHIYIQVSV